MPTVTAIRAAIKTKIESVTDIGVVHDYERYTKEAAKFRELYFHAASNRILGWHVRRVSTRELLTDHDRWSVFHGWRIRGFMGLEDAEATEKSFDDKIEALRDAFREDDDLGGLVLTCVNPDSGEAGLQLIEHNPVLLAGVLCHKAELALTTQHLDP